MRRRCNQENSFSWQEDVTAARQYAAADQKQNRWINLLGLSRLRTDDTHLRLRFFPAVQPDLLFATKAFRDRSLEHEYQAAFRRRAQQTLPVRLFCVGVSFPARLSTHALFCYASCPPSSSILPSFSPPASPNADGVRSAFPKTTAGFPLPFGLSPNILIRSWPPLLALPCQSGDGVPCL